MRFYFVWWRKVGDRSRLYQEVVPIPNLVVNSFFRLYPLSDEEFDGNTLCYSLIFIIDMILDHLVILTRPKSTRPSVIINMYLIFHLLQPIGC